MRTIIKNITRYTLALVVLLTTLGLNKAVASHYAAADIKLDYIGTDSNNLKYRVTVTIYKACKYVGSGTADLSTSETVNWASLSANFRTSRAFNSPKEDTLDHLCPNFSAQNTCRSPEASPALQYQGYTRRQYIDTVTLPSHQKDWVFWWSSGARNASIANLTPSEGNIYIEAVINNTGTHWNNSSPRYDNDPFPFICVNLPEEYNTDVSDPDLDSLVTFNNIPLSTGPATVTTPGYVGPGAVFPTGYSQFGYIAPASATNPVASVTPYTVNRTTGTAFFTPPNTGQYVIAFRTEQYDRYTGEYLGRILRDAQVAIVTCNTPRPVVDSVPVNGNIPILADNTYAICPNTPITFSLRARAAVGSNYIKMTATNKPVGSYFTTSVGGGTTTGTFSWTPTTADIGTHIITILAEDTTCLPPPMGSPIILRQSRKITIRVLPGLDAGVDKKVCPLGDYPAEISVNGPQTNTYSWTNLSGGRAEFLDCVNCPVVHATPPYDYTYVVSSADPLFACKKSDTVKVVVDNSNGVDATQDRLVVCRPGYVTLTADPLGPNPVSNLACGTTNIQNCNIPDQVFIGNLGNTAFDTTNSPFYSQSKYHKYQFIISKADMHNAGVYSGSLKSIAFHSNNTVALGANPLANLRISLKCTRSARYPGTVSNSDFETGTTLVATVASYTITPNSWNVINFTTPYNWDTSQNLLVDICMGDAAFVANINGLDNVDMAPGQAIQRTSNTADVCAANATSLAIYTQRPVVRFDYCQAPPLPFRYQWAPGTYLSDSNIQNPVAYVPRSINYAVYTWGRNGCKVRDSLHIIVPIHKLDLQPVDTTICVGQPAQLRAYGASAGYIWYEDGFKTPTTLSCTNCSNPVAIPDRAGDITYAVVFLDTAGCYDTLRITMHVNPLPNVRIGNNDTTIKYGQHVNLLVTGANQYTWTPVGTLSDPNVPNPVATPTVTTDYIVYGATQYNCRSSDTIRITVDNRDNLLVPSGFTPNGDGKNDVFKVVNVSFQKLMEFRVFNRWGQEVFSTTDPSRGWDGTWKGVEQDMGNYAYIIRVAFPDGFVETYKGEITLIR